MTLESAVNSTLGTPAATLLTIRNTDSEFAFAGDKSFPENAGSAGVWVTRTGGVVTPAIVRYSTANGSATAGTDYLAASAILNFAVGETSKQVLITLRDDLAWKATRPSPSCCPNPPGRRR